MPFSTGLYASKLRLTGYGEIHCGTTVLVVATY